MAGQVFFVVVPLKGLDLDLPALADHGSIVMHQALQRWDC
jgi:hypothetical protein